MTEGEKVAVAPDFWNDAKNAEAFLKKLSGKKYWVNAIDSLKREGEDFDVLKEMGAPEEEIAQQDTLVTRHLEEVEFKSMLSAEGDNLGALVKINSGAGGTESNDWSSMLMRMYTRWGERNGYKVTITDLLAGDEAGIKSVTL
ncbi:MAG TPA: PCRF domain-containing protein, partial [Candidatus Egerieousia sp.]|nr:PCRF domain-containing protein [Candidatus Egerieousia sp.]